ncbi:MAG: GEVED domain-containing protein, partial [Bacteroidota bacterium]
MSFFYSRVTRSVALLFLFSLFCIPVIGQYCIPAGNCTGPSITNFTVEGDNGTVINNTTGCSPGGYGDFSNMRVTMSSLGMYTVTATVGGGSLSSSGNLFIDWNNDSTFSTTTELYTALGATGEMIFTIIPVTGTTSGLKRMRLVTTGTANIGGTGAVGLGPCATNATEVEDYTVLFVYLGEAVPDCITKAQAYPLDSATNICQKTTLKWNAVTDATGYRFSLFNGTTPVIKDSVVTGTSFTPPILNENTKYYWIVTPFSEDSPAFNCDTLEFSTSPNLDPVVNITPGFGNKICQDEPFEIGGNPTEGTLPYKHSWNGTR